MAMTPEQLASLPRAVREQMEMATASMETGDKSIMDSVPIKDVTGTGTSNVKGADNKELNDIGATPTVEPVNAPTPINTQSVNWENKFRTLKGKYDSEVPRLHAALKESHNDITTLQAQLKEIEVNGQNHDVPKTEGLNDPSNIELRESLVSDFGEETAESLFKMMDSKTSELQNKIKTLEANQNTSTNNSQVDKFETELTQLYPSWATLNADQEFINWLDNNVETYSGKLFRELLVNAANTKDAIRVSDIMKKYSYSQPQSQNIGIANQVAPDSVQSKSVVATQNATTKRTYSGTEWRAEQRRALTVLGMNTEAGKTLHEELINALTEGRVIS